MTRFERKPPQPPEGNPTFLKDMSKVAELFTPNTSTEFTNLPNFKQVKLEAGINLPFTDNDSTKITAGIEAKVSIFNCPTGPHLAKSLLPCAKLTQDIGNNTTVTGKIAPNPREFVNLGVRINF